MKSRYISTGGINSAALWNLKLQLSKLLELLWTLKLLRLLELFIRLLGLIMLLELFHLRIVQTQFHKLLFAQTVERWGEWEESIYRSFKFSDLDLYQMISVNR